MIRNIAGVYNNNTQSVLKLSLSIELRAKYHRKPRWLPVAKSKLFRIPERPKVSQEEYKELTRITNNYHTSMRAVSRFLHDELMAEKASVLDKTSDKSKQEEALKLEQRLKLNDEWNATVAKIRDLRLTQEREKRDKAILNHVEMSDRRAQYKIEAANEIVCQQMEESKTFITRDTLDSAIDEAFANTVDYNFAIDLEGNRYYGRKSNSAFEKKIEKKK